MKTPRTFAACAVAGALLMQAAFARPHTPPKGSPERTAIMNAMRRVLGSGRHKPLVQPYHFKVERGWAYMGGEFVYADGAPLEERFREGVGTNFSALLHRERGKWRIKKWMYHGDVAEQDFIRAFPQAPRAIFKM